jgi:hypothetical protein
MDQQLFALRCVAAEARNATKFMIREEDRVRLRQLADELEKRVRELEEQHSPANSA